MTLRAFLRDERCPESIRELAREPLILYLLAAMQGDGQLQPELFEAVEARQVKVQVYEQTLDWVLNQHRSDGGRSLNPALTGLAQEDLHTVLAEAGLCVVQSGGEFAALKHIESRLIEQDEKGAVALINQARQGSEQVLANALAAFYVKSAAADNCVEFFHKSFGEFLCAECMTETLMSWTETVKKRGRSSFAISEKEVNWQIYDLFGYGNLTVEIVDYLMGLLIRQDVDFVTLFERLHEFYLSWCNGDFIEAWDLSDELLPLKKARQLQQQGIERGQRQVDIYTGLNVLILLLELHRYGQSHEELKEALHFHPCGDPESQEFDSERLLRVIGYADFLEAAAFAKKVGYFLRTVDLHNAILSGVNLQNVDLSAATLTQVSLAGAYLKGANLAGATLNSSNLNNANLTDVNLTHSSLSGTSLQGSILRYANLSSTNLEGASLNNADLTKITWNKNTVWSNSLGLNEVSKVPAALKHDQGFADALLLSQKISLMQEGKVQEVITAIRNIQILNPHLDVSPSFLNSLCWYGCLYNYASDVLFAGEKAVELAPWNTFYRNARGLARALTGNQDGAIEDFEIVLSSGSMDSRSTRKRKRQRWLEALKAGENPFTLEELEALRREEG